MDELDPESKALFDSARHASNPTQKDRARITALLSAKLGGAAFLATSGVAAGTTAKALSAAAKLKVLLFTQIGPALLVGAAIGGSATYVIHSQLQDKPATPTKLQTPRPPAPNAVATVTPPAVPTTDPETVPNEPSEPERTSVPIARKTRLETSTRKREPSTTTAEHASVAEAPEKSALSSELQMIARMHAASRAGDWASVERAVKSHEQQFPSGALAEEREAIKTISACRRANPERASELGAQFAKLHPGSTYVGRVRSACTGERK